MRSWDTLEFFGMHIACFQTEIEQQILIKPNNCSEILLDSIAG